tara:strand:- start:1188 stop:1619 length:432 start_codon:yes stop_codon:yes gene_type:complete
MGIFGKLFGSKKLKTTDSDFGEIESFNVRGNDVGWTFKKQFLDSNVEILIDGDKEKISETQKRTLKGALNNESEIKSESEKALKEQFDNAELEFVSIEKHFDVDSITVNDNGFELSFQEKNDPYYYFNVHFEDNKQVGVSIDG